MYTYHGSLNALDGFMLIKNPSKMDLIAFTRNNDLFNPKYQSLTEEQIFDKYTIKIDGVRYIYDFQCIDYTIEGWTSRYKKIDMIERIMWSKTTTQKLLIKYGIDFVLQKQKELFDNVLDHCVQDRDNRSAIDSQEKLDAALEAIKFDIESNTFIHYNHKFKLDIETNKFISDNYLHEKHNRDKTFSFPATFFKFDKYDLTLLPHEILDSKENILKTFHDMIYNDFSIHEYIINEGFTRYDCGFYNLMYCQLFYVESLSKLIINLNTRDYVYKLIVAVLDMVFDRIEEEKKELERLEIIRKEKYEESKKQWALEDAIKEQEAERYNMGLFHFIFKQLF